MAYQVLLDSVDITNKTTSINIERQLNSGVVGFTLDTFNIGGVKLFKTIIIKKNSVTLVQGIVVDQTDRADVTNKRIFSNLTCQDFGYLLNKRIVAQNYTNQTITNIMKDLLTKKASELSQTNIDTNSTITSAKFIYMPLSNALNYLFDLAIGWHYYIDGNNGFHFFDGFESTGSTITATDIDLEGLTINYDGIDTYNRVWIVGRKQPSTTLSQIPYVANGTQIDFGVLPYEPYNLRVYFKPSGLPEYELDLVEEGDDASGADGTYNAAKRTFRISPAKTGDLRATFYPMRQVVEYFENSASIATYPLMEKAVTNVDVIDRLEARKYGLAEVNATSKIIKTISFQTSKLLNIEIGQKVVFNINHEAWTITGNYLVKKVTRNITPDFEVVQVEAEEIA